jgi:gamma-glutamylcyclotransferase
VPLYFAYGSNLSHKRMLNERCPGAVPIGAGVLKGWRYLIYKKGHANIIPDESRSVWGGVWEVSGEHLQTLDRYEGALKPDPVYHQEDVEIELADGSRLSCIAYIDSSEDADIPGTPNASYLNYILEGASEFGLPEDYQEFLKSASGDGKAKGLPD